MILEDVTKWKAMGDLTQYSMLGNPNLGRLYISPSSVNIFEDEEKLEADIKTLLKKYRDERKLFTRFNDDLSCVLTSALQSYEVGRVTGSSVSSESFQAGIKNIIPDGHVFKAFPIQVNHKNPVGMFSLVTNNPVGEEILSMIGDQIAYGVRVKVVQYPEDVCAVWLIIGIQYIEI